MEYKVHLYYGDGKGKTSAATGRALRWLGSGGSVCYAQFLKNGDSNEIDIISKLNNLYYLCVDRDFGFTWFMSDSEKREAARAYSNLLDLALGKVLDGTADMLILDELADLIDTGLIEEDYIINKLNSVKGKAEIIITGHICSDNLIAFADYVTSFEKVKHPYDEGLEARKGVEY